MGLTNQGISAQPRQTEGEESLSSRANRKELKGEGNETRGDAAADGQKIASGMALRVNLREEEDHLLTARDLILR